MRKKVLGKKSLRKKSLRKKSLREKSLRKKIISIKGGSEILNLPRGVLGRIIKQTKISKIPTIKQTSKVLKNKINNEESNNYINLQEYIENLKEETEYIDNEKLDNQKDEGKLKNMIKSPEIIGAKRILKELKDLKNAGVPFVYITKELKLIIPSPYIDIDILAIEILFKKNYPLDTPDINFILSGSFGIETISMNKYYARKYSTKSLKYSDWNTNNKLSEYSMNLQFKIYDFYNNKTPLSIEKWSPAINILDLIDFIKNFEKDVEVYFKQSNK